ncbi:serine/threonine-specific protein kinase-like protein [Ectocarpus siliculosus]|uniref:Serine/threonine-specific protein kinase-like protein n=1 Tax=Ectocarpus siliculosus TaxID=2880 RepID=D7G1Q5_ECTSI|nr:serine/threonine-specific protein kinase-like protein [Ectocarpus siliculosus]|eukprot:CBJ33300.1 serine/threonine-specific protein kinase-like protein [Ectocarpus siliculosus]
MPGATAAGSPSKYITAALADLFSCIGGGDIVSAKALLEGKHKNDKEAILSATNPAGITLLQHACHSGQAGGVNMLLEKGADPNWTSTKGSTPLHFACNNGHFDCAEALLRAGVDVDAGNANGTTPLIIAAFGAHASCVRLLLEHDADPNVRDKLGRRAGDSLCGTINAVSGRVGVGVGGGSGSAAGGGGAATMSSGGATQGTKAENEPFSETRSLLAVARTQRSTRRGRSDSTASSSTTSTACVDVKSRGAVGGSAVGGNAICTHGGTAGVVCASAGAGSAGHVDPGPDGLERSPTLATAAEGTGKDARLPSAKLPPPSSLVAGKPSGDMVGHSSCSGSTGTSTSVSGNGNGNGSAGSGSACNRAAQTTIPLPPANTAELDSVPSVLAAAAAAAAAASRPTPTAAGAASFSGEATPPTLANSPRTTPMPSPAPSPRRASKLLSSSSVLSPQLQQSQLPSRGSSTPTFPSPLAASAATDPELDHPGLQSKRSADLKAALAANAAMIRSMQEEERAFSVQRDLLERRRGEAGARRKGAEEHAALLRAQAGELARKDAPGTPLMPVMVGGGANTPASARGDAGSGRSPEPPPALMPPSPVSDSNNNASSVFDTPTSGAAAGEEARKALPEARSGATAPRAASSSSGCSPRCVPAYGPAAVAAVAAVAMSAWEGTTVTPAVSAADLNRTPVSPPPPASSSITITTDKTTITITITISDTRSPRIPTLRWWKWAGMAVAAAGCRGSRTLVEVFQWKAESMDQAATLARARRRCWRHRDGRSQRSRTNANKRQRAGTTSLSSQRLQHSDAATDGARGIHHGHMEGGSQCFSPRGTIRITDVATSSPSSSSSLSDPMSPGLRSEVRRLRAEAAARGREHASLAAQHASLVLEKARQAGVLRNRVASADGEVERLSRKLREAQEKLEAQAREAEALRRQAEGQQGLLHSRSHVLEQALGRLENIGVALAEERSLNSARSRDNGQGNGGGGDAPNAVGGGSDADGPANANGDREEEGCEEDGGAGSVPMRDVGVEENEAAAGAAAGAPAASAMAAGAGERPEDRPQGGLEMARIFSHQQIDAACAGFPDSAIVGRGGFGPVFRGRFMGEDVAVKRLDGYGLQGLPNFLKEVQVLTTCRHEHLVPLLGICVDPTPMLVYPFVGQSLEWHLREPQRRAAIGWRTRLSVALSISKGLQYLHQPQAGAWGKPVIVHRDVKTENILMDSNLRARLSDVGIARQLDGAGSEASTRLIGTWGYIDPEYQETGVLTPASDVYSLGVVFLELLTGLPAHSAQLRPSCLVDRVNGKQLSDCLDSACSWPDTPPVVSFAKEAWQCVSRQGDGRPRLQHLIERMERLDLGDDAGGGAGTAAAANSDSSGAGPAESAPNASVLASPLPPPTPASSTALPPGVVAGPTMPGSSIAASAAAVAAASAAATAARAATEAAAAAAAAVASGASSLMPPQPQPAVPPSPPSPAMADAAVGGAVAGATSSPMAAPSPSPEAGRDCMICASAPVQTRFLPCRHSLACTSCASLLRARGDRCPVDRARIIGLETGQFQVTYTGD